MDKEVKKIENIEMYGQWRLVGDAARAVDRHIKNKKAEGVKVYGKELAINFLLCQQWKTMNQK